MKNILLIISIIFFSLSSCGLKKMLPKKAVLSETKRKELLDKKFHPVNYTGEAKVNFPIIPFPVFGITYDQDIVIVTQHPEWNMHEYAKILLPEDKEMWLMKDSREGSLDQYLSINDAGLLDMVPEIPLETSVQDIKVKDKSDDKNLDISFGYTNLLNEEVEVYYRGSKKLGKLKKRNGSTMGHSKNQVMAVLDLPYRNFGKKATVTYNDKHYPVKKLLGIKNFQMLLQQTQGGISKGTYRIKDHKGTHFTTYHDNNVKEEIEQFWDENFQQEHQLLFAEQKNKYRSQTYAYVVEEANHYLLQSATIQIWNYKEPAFKITFSPPLPDLRKKFEKTYESDFVMDINGQKNHGIGKVKCYWQDKDHVIVEIIPQQPWWIADRPMKSVVEFKGSKEVEVKCFMSK